jgi:hypothetical protein
MPKVSPGDRARPHTHTQSHTQTTSLGSPSVNVASAREAQNETDPLRAVWP